MNIFNLVRKQYIKLIIRYSNDREKANLCRKYYGVNIGDNVRITGIINWGTEPF